MRTRILLLGCLFFFLPRFCLSVPYDTPDCLYLHTGDIFQAAGVIYKNVSIVVEPGAGIYLPSNMTTDPSQWSLQLVAPNVYIGGTLCADGASYYTGGIGLAGSDSSGPGGSGYGNYGGDGQNHAGSGGYPYNITYRESTGSQGINHTKGGGGGSIRIDALSLTLGATALITANADQYWMIGSGGGGSGGCILLNGIKTDLEPGYQLYAQGGSGQSQFRIYNPITHIWTILSYGGGGGSGGRIKIFRYAVFSDSGGTTSTAGGAGGGGGATAGGEGQYIVYSASLPTSPTLLTPENGQTTGCVPTFNFFSNDNPASQFFNYWIEIRTVSPSAITVTASQLNPNSSGWAGWSGVPYFKAGQMAAYTMPWRLTSNTDYSWRVRVTNNLGSSWTSYTAARTFTTIDNNQPLKPALLYPQPTPEQTNVLKTPLFQVMSADPDGNSLTFSIILSQDPGLSNPKIIQPSYAGWDNVNYPSAYHYAGITATCQLDSADELEAGKTYYWKTIAYDQYQETEVSDIGSFRIVPRPSRPALLYPVDNAVVTISTPDLQMSATSPAGGDLRYHLELSANDFQSTTNYLSQSGADWSQPQYASGQTASLKLSAANALITGKTYQWRVRAYDTYSGDWSFFSAEQSFTVITPPLVPQLLSPENHYQAPDANVLFQFQAISDSGNTLTYRFELARENFQNVSQQIFDQTPGASGWGASSYPSGTMASFTLPAGIALERGVTYCWRVRANDGFSWGPASEIRYFSLATNLDILQSKLYPNPAVSCPLLHLEITPSVAADIYIQIFNSQARQIKTISAQVRGGMSNDITLDISSFACGAYYAVMRLTSPWGEKKIVKRFAVVN